MLTSVKKALFEPSGFWLGDNLRPSGTSTYVQGVEVPFDYSGKIPEGFEMIELPPCTYLVFNGQPYDDENFIDEVNAVIEAIQSFNPQTYGYEWDDTSPVSSWNPAETEAISKRALLKKSAKLFCIVRKCMSEWHTLFYIA